MTTAKDLLENGMAVLSDIPEPMLLEVMALMATSCEDDSKLKDLWEMIGEQPKLQRIVFLSAVSFMVNAVETRRDRTASN